MPKIAIITGYNAKCGIATYAEKLVSALSSKCQIKVFAEHVKNVPQDSDSIVYCWSRDNFPNLDLLNELENYNPDYVIINHEYGYYPQAYKLTNLVSWCHWKKYKVIGILHSVYEKHFDKTVSESCFKNIIVHTKQSKECLIRKGINSEKIFVIPHGCELPNNELLDRLWNHWGTPYTIFSAGFLFYYKGIHTTLEAVSKLKSTYPNIQYTLCGSENPLCQAEHDELYKGLIETANQLDIMHNININRGFFTPEVILSHVRTSSVCVLPYNPHPEHDVCATSGIARMILQTTTPLITSNAHLFDDIHELVTKINTSDELAEAIDKIFQGHNQVNQEKRKQFLLSNSWDNMSGKILSLLDQIK